MKASSEMKKFESLTAAIQAGANTGMFEVQGIPWVWRLFGDVCETRPQWANYWIPSRSIPDAKPAVGAVVDWSIPISLYEEA